MKKVKKLLALTGIMVVTAACMSSCLCYDPLMPPPPPVPIYRTVTVVTPPPPPPVRRIYVW